MLKTELTGGYNENGTPKIKYTFDGSDGMEGVVVTGPAKGTIVLADGTVYDVTPEVIEHKPGHAQEITEKIEDLLRASGKLAEIRQEP
jgi:hypothetical protein